MRPLHFIARVAGWWGTAALVAVLFRTLKQVGSKELLDMGQSSLAVITGVCILSVMVVMPFAAWSGARQIRKTGSICKSRRKAVVGIFCCAALEVLAGWMFLEALRLGSLSIAGPLAGTVPFFAFFIGLKRGNERESQGKKFAGVVMVVLGIFLVQGFDLSTVTGASSALAIGCAAIYAVSGQFSHLAVDEKNGAAMPADVYAFFLLIAYTILYGIWMLVAYGSFEPVWAVISQMFEDPHLLLFTVVFGSLGFVLTAQAFVTGEVTQVSAMLKLEILTSIVGAALFFGEDVRTQLIGGVALLVGVVLVAWPKKAI
jgi:drug/metabolite transporter (DMT)-like permease